ncbi:Eaa protein [Salmonella enterica subsp. enterica serovar Newport]|nr:Eaa protein [Salmonella enterica subsp. enterica serovar Newport]EEE6328691.1 Eaa protein [Salmonella enterica subsp. enterica serovar Enteritidis]EGC2933269.1 Eaa protein [Salmonella enterica subsp. enterica serovar Newport]EJU2882528.1 Eaa protein [Salmonella enterica subsp. enterica serovar Newport]
MTTITREQAQEIIDAADEVITALAGTNEDVHPDNSQEMIRLYDDLNDHYAPPEVVRELARIALASLEVAPVGEVSEKRHGLVMDGTVDLGGKSTYRIIKGEKAMKRLPLGTKFYIVPPVPVDNEFIPKNLDRALGVVGVALPESKEEFNFQTERWIQRLIDRVIRYADEFKEQPTPVVPETLPCSVELKPGLIIGKGCKTETLLSALQRRYDYNAEIDAMTPEERAERDAGIEAFKAMLPTPADSQGRPRAPVVPEDISGIIERFQYQADHLSDWHHIDEHSCKVNRRDLMTALEFMDSCRAAMLNGGKS